MRRASTLSKLLLAAVVAGVLLAAIAFPVVGGLGLSARNSITAFDNIDAVLADDGRPPERSVIVAADGTTPIANLYLTDQNRQIVSYDQIPQVARTALVAIEDSRFYCHHGVDPRGMLRALVTNGRSGSVQQGGSTLTQQYIKQVLEFSATTTAGRQAATADTLSRKLKEARMALELEKKLSKDEIITRYMNIAYYGHGAYGIETAAETYFGIHAAQLNLPQAAMLAGMMQSPSGYDPYHHMTEALARRHEVLTHMADQGYITTAQENQADATPIALTNHSTAPANGCSEAITPGTGFFCDYVRKYLTNTLHLSQQQLDTGGLLITTTLNPQLQASANAAVNSKVPCTSAASAAAVSDVVQPGTGQLLAMAVNRTFGGSSASGCSTEVPLGVKAASQAGSTYKAFTLAAALEKHVPISYPIPSPSPYTSKVFGVTVRNDSGEQCLTCTLQSATVKSINTYFIQLLGGQYFNRDLSEPVSVAARTGLAAHTLSAATQKAIVQNNDVLFTLGNQLSSPLDMATAYATFAAQGTTCAVVPVISVRNASGKTIAAPKPSCKKVLAPNIATGVNNILAGVANPHVTNNTTDGVVTVGANHAAAGKTGTNNTPVTVKSPSGDASSLWYVGYTPKYSASVAVFNAQASSTPVPLPAADRYGRFASGIWQAELGPTISAEPKSAWPPINPSVAAGNSVKVPCVLDSTVDAALTGLNQVGLQAPSPIHQFSDAVPNGSVISQSPACGATAYPNQNVQLVVSDGSSPVPTTTPPPPIIPTVPPTPTFTFTIPTVTPTISSQPPLTPVTTPPPPTTTPPPAPPSPTPPPTTRSSTSSAPPVHPTTPPPTTRPTPPPHTGNPPVTTTPPPTLQRPGH